MKLFQLSSGQGPDECARAVFLAARQLVTECRKWGVTATLVDSETGAQSNTYKSVLFEVSGDDMNQLKAHWQGSLMWSCQSPFRKGYKRKNWFFSGTFFDVSSQNMSSEIRFQSCRASGAGGQHVNKTDSAIQATHVASGISVRVERARSQHANKRLAVALIAQKLEQQLINDKASATKQRWSQHYQVQRGAPLRVFKGVDFKPA